MNPINHAIAKAPSEPREWIAHLARAGYAARGLVYVIIGLFTVLAAFGEGDKKSSEGALVELLSQPFGTALVWLMVGGLFGFVVWRVVQAVADLDEHGRSVRGLAVRGALLTSALTYGSLGIFALSLLGVWSSGGEGGTPIADKIAGLVGYEFVSLALSVTFLIVAGAHWFKAAKQGYAEHMKADEARMQLIHPISVIGLSARGAIFAVGSVLLFYRFLNYRPAEGQPPGLTEVLGFIQALPLGSLLLAATGVGLMMFAAYSVTEAIWRRVEVKVPNSR